MAARKARGVRRVASDENGPLGEGAQWPSEGIGRCTAGCDNLLGRDILLDPLFERGEDVARCRARATVLPKGVEPWTAAAMTHARCHEEAEKILGIAQRTIMTVAAVLLIERDDILEVV